MSEWNMHGTCSEGKHQNNIYSYQLYARNPRKQKKNCIRVLVLRSTFWPQTTRTWK